MRPVFFAATFVGLFLASNPNASAQGGRVGPEPNKYLFMFYAIDDMTREFKLDEIAAIKKNSEATVYADRIGTLYTKRKMILNSFRRHAENIKLDQQCYDGIEEANSLLKHVGAYHEKLKEAQSTYDLGFRSIQAKLFTDAELREKMLQSSVNAESYYLSNMEGRQKSEAALYGVTRSMKRLAVADYKLDKNKQKLAEDVHAACLKYETENRPALEAKIDSIHREFATEYPRQYKEACQTIESKFKPLAGKMEVSQLQVFMISLRSDFDWSKDGTERPRDPFRLISAARKTKIETASEAKAAHEFARECLRALEWVPLGDPRDTTEVFFYYRGLLSGWAGTLSTKAAAIQLGSEGLDKAFPNAIASTALSAWNLYKAYEKSAAFPRTHTIASHVAAYAYSGRIQDGYKLAKDSAGERVDDPNYWYLLARMCGVYKYGSKANIETYYEEGTLFMRRAMELGFTGVDEAKLHSDLYNMRQNPRIASKLNTAMYEPDNLFKLTRVSSAAKK